MEARHRQAGDDWWDKTWRNDRGEVTVWQFPNRWLIAWAVLNVASFLLYNQKLVADVLSWAASAALIVWALLEITQGANYFRRALGVLVLLFAIATLIKSF